MTITDMYDPGLREYFGEKEGEKRRVILSVKFIDGRSTRIDLEPCTLANAIAEVKAIENNGIAVPAEDMDPCYHTGEHAKDVLFRHPPHTIVYIEILRRRAWKVDDDRSS